LLPRSAYIDSPDVVARRLLGKLLVRSTESATLIARIVETEAYLGTDDPAAHAFAGRTARTEVLFGAPGHAYVYTIYGIYACLNVSCEPEGHAGCVLIRALEPIAGLPEMTANRGLAAGARPAALTAGPGRLCRALDITRAEFNGIDLTDASSTLQARDDGFAVRDRDLAITGRIGVNKASERPLRFALMGHPCVSKGKFHKL